jgi:biotin carboxyl carrier protein
MSPIRSIIDHLGWRTLAISGVDSLDRRAHKVQLLESLAAAAGRGREPVWHPGHADALSPQVLTPLQDYLDFAHAQRLGILPVLDPRAAETSPATAALIVEDFTTERSDAHFQQAAQGLLEASRGRLLNQQAADRIPGARWLRGLARRRAHHASPFRGPVLAAAALLLLVLVGLVPVPFRIPAAGSLQPARRQHVFAPEAATVDRLFVEQGAHVAQGAPLLQLAAPELELELATCLGDLQVVRQQRQSMYAQRLVLRPAAQTERQVAEDKLAAEEQRLAQEAELLGRQLELLKARLDALRVVSPLTGQVLTWEASQLLASRPVQRGQKLLTIADPKGPWALELQVADRDIQEVLAARERAGGELALTYSLGVEPARKHRGIIEKISWRSESKEGGYPTVRVLVSVDKEQLPSLRAGSEVVAHIDCGRRALVYAWCRGAWNSVRLHWFW